MFMLVGRRTRVETENADSVRMRLRRVRDIRRGLVVEEVGPRRFGDVVWVSEFWGS